MIRSFVAGWLLLSLVGCTSGSSGTSKPSPVPNPTVGSSLAAVFADPPAQAVVLTVASNPQATAATAPTLIRGPEHCDAERTSWLLLPGTARRAPNSTLGYIRDPSGSAAGFARTTFADDAALPSQARFTGWTYGTAEFWSSPADRDAFIYVVHRGEPKQVERWPALRGLCA